MERHLILRRKINILIFFSVFSLDLERGSERYGSLSVHPQHTNTNTPLGYLNWYISQQMFHFYIQTVGWKHNSTLWTTMEINWFSNQLCLLAAFRIGSFKIFKFKNSISSHCCCVTWVGLSKLTYVKFW